jgi:hypothetical protein
VGRTCYFADLVVREALVSYNQGVLLPSICTYYGDSYCAFCQAVVHEPMSQSVESLFGWLELLEPDSCLPLSKCLSAEIIAASAAHAKDRYVNLPLGLPTTPCNATFPNL